MLLGKPKDKFEVYNDLDDELVNLFRCVRDRPAEFLLELGLLPLNSRTEFGEWLKFHTGRRDPALFLPMQDVILDNLLPMKEWAEQMKKALHDRADYKEVLQAAAFFKRMRNSYGITVEQQTFTGIGVGHIGKLVGRNAQLLGENLPVTGGLVEHIDEVRIL